MTEHSLPEEVESFFAAYSINAVEQLEVLLLLVRTAPRVWSAVEAATELRLSRASVERRLQNLEMNALLKREGLGYRYPPESPAHSAILAAAEAYRERRVAVITSLFSKKKT